MRGTLVCGIATPPTVAASENVASYRFDSFPTFYEVIFSFVPVDPAKVAVHVTANNTGSGAAPWAFVASTAGQPLKVYVRSQLSSHFAFTLTVEEIP